MKRTTLKLTLAALLVAGALGLVVHKHQMSAALCNQNLALKDKLTQLEHIEEDNQRLNRLLAESRPETPEKPQAELARLRAELERLQKRKEEWNRLCAENRQLRAELGNGVRPAIPQESWAYAGYGDPESACQSHFWAAASGDAKLALDSLCPEARASWAQCSDEEVAAFVARLQKSIRKRPSFQILGQRKISDDEVELIADIYPDRPDVENWCPTFKRVGSEWRFYGCFHHF
jgi:hypothetical protein